MTIEEAQSDPRAKRLLYSQRLFSIETETLIILEPKVQNLEIVHCRMYSLEKTLRNNKAGLVSRFFNDCGFFNSKKK